MTDRFNLHGKKERRSPVALLLIDVINDLEFERRRGATGAGLADGPDALATLKRRARQEWASRRCTSTTTSGGWRSDFPQPLVAHCADDDVRDRVHLASRQLRPDEEDYFVLKPKRSGFFDTTLHTLLQHLGAERLILTGVAADVCILFTAHDAHLRDYRIIVPSDCVASNTKRETEQALRNMTKATKAKVVASSRVDFTSLSRRSSTMKAGRR